MKQFLSPVPLADLSFREVAEEEAEIGVDALTSRGQRLLVAVLLNPPEGEGKRTVTHLQVVRDCLNCDVVQIVNLYPHATKDLAGLGRVAGDAKDWIEQRHVISMALRQADEVLLGWGVSLPTGAARAQMIAQVGWAIDELQTLGVVPWVVGDGPRHPSRWHQYVSDRHGRTSGGPLAERIRDSVVQLELSAA